MNNDNTPLTPEERALKAFPPFILSNKKDAMQHNREVYVIAWNDCAAQFQSRIAELEQWKREAVEVMTGFDIQAIGKEIDAPLASDISPQVLPAIKKFKERIDELERENERLKQLNETYQSVNEYLHSKTPNQETSEFIRQFYECVQEKKTLMGLLEKQFKKQKRLDYENGLMVIPMVGMKERLESAWQSYCREHKLKIDTDGK